MSESKTKLDFENRAWDKADIKRLVSQRVELPHQLRYQFPHATSAVFEVSYHYNLGGYVITVYGYSAPEKRGGKIDPCFGGLVKEHQNSKDFIVFPDEKRGLGYARAFLEAWGYEVAFN